MKKPTSQIIRKKLRQGGFGMVEIGLGLVIATILIIGVVTYFASNTATAQANQLGSDLSMLIGRVKSAYAGQYANVMMAADSRFTSGGVVGSIPQGDAEDMAALEKSYAHVAKLRDEVIAAGIIPPVSEWKSLNPNL